jgi:hypothetical protein
MNIQDILTSLLTERRDIDVKSLPSQGLFYPEDLRLSIRKAEFWDILDYESNIDRTNIIKSIECIKSVVERCVSLNEPYTYSHLKSVDIIFIFLEIVKYTNGREIMVKYEDKSGIGRQVAFGPETFNYFDFSPFMKYYSEGTREMIINDYRFSFPSIGVENSLTGYIASTEDASKFKDVAFDFIFFVSGRHDLGHHEVENLIQIFNHDLDEVERKKVSEIIGSFAGIVSYSLKVDGVKIEMKSNINLENIWHT